jgi:hypothetical protein
MSVVKFFAGVVVGLLLAFGIFLALPKKPSAVIETLPVLPAAPVITSCSTTTYDQVVPSLDAGGKMLVYMDAQGMRQAGDQMFDTLRRFVKIGAKGRAQEAEAGLKAIDTCSSLFKTCGMTDIDGFGFSTIETSSGRFHSKCIAHRKPGSVDDGLVWNLLQSKDPASRGSDLLKVMPANAAVVVGGDCNLAEFRTWLKSMLKANGSPAAIDGFDKFEKAAADEGFGLDRVLASYAGRMALVVAIDDKQKMPVPMLKDPIAMPMAALVVAVNDGKLFDLIAGKATKDGKFKVVGTGERRQLILIDPAGLPPAFNPVLVQDGKLLVLATLSALADSIFATQANGKGLLSTPEFQDWSSHIGAEANGFCYVSPAATTMFTDIRDQYFQTLKSQNPESVAGLDDLVKRCYNFPTGFTACTVDKMGILIKSNVQKNPPAFPPAPPEEHPPH